MHFIERDTSPPINIATGPILSDTNNHAIPNYYNSMTKSVYHDYIAQKGYTEQECYRPAAKKQFPLNLYGRIFETEEEYNDAIADMLNGM